MQSIRLTISSNLKNVSLVGLAIKGICSSVPISEIDIYQLELCVVEAINNIIKHAYECNPDNKIALDVSLSHDQISFLISDSGKSFDFHNTTRSTIETKDLDSLPESGMGIFIINSIMDKVFYEAKDGENVLSMTKFFPKKSL